MLYHHYYGDAHVLNHLPANKFGIKAKIIDIYQQHRYELII
jgi:hypothetical protein